MTSPRLPTSAPPARPCSRCKLWPRKVGLSWCIECTTKSRREAKARRKTHWDRPGHFICSDQCGFGMTDVVGGFVVSTVGDYHEMNRGPRERIGANRYYETMVFQDTGDRCDTKGCKCGGIPNHDGRDVDFDGYKTAAEATRGHAAMVAKVAAHGYQGRFVEP